MAVVIGTNSGFVTESPTANPSGSATIIDTTSMSISSVTPSYTTSVTEIGWYCSNATEATNFEVGIYEDNGSDLPGDLITSYTTNAKGTGEGWKKVNVDIALSADTKYWIAVQVDDTATTTFIDYTNSSQRRSLDNGSTQLVDPWVNDGTSESTTLALYAVVELTIPTIAISKSIDFNNGTITTAKLTATESVGTGIYEMTADGTNYEVVTNGTAHTFSNTGTDLRWKASGSSVTITKIEITDYH